VLVGPFAEYEGLVERYMPASDRVRLLLRLVGGGRQVEVEARQIRSDVRNRRLQARVVAGGWVGAIPVV